jgi:pteridine reductase
MTPTNQTVMKSNDALAGKVALVTGGAKRVGAAVALRLAACGMDVAITYNTSKSEAMGVVDAIEKLNRRAIAIKVDFAQPERAASLVYKKITGEFDRLDALINNASMFSPTPIAKLMAKDYSLNMAVNALSPLLLIQRFAPMLAANARVDDPASLGRVVNFIDIHVMGQPLKGFVAYNASKAALQEVTRTMALELAPKITVNAIAPGVVAWAESYTPAAREAYMRRVPLARPGTPDDAADAVLFLVRHGHYCTGQTIRLDGGRLWT